MTDHENLKQFQLLYQSAPIGLCFFDKEFRYIYVNDWLAQLAGRPVSEHMGRSIHEIIPKIAPQVELACRKVLESKQPVLNVEVGGALCSEAEPSKYYLSNYYPVFSESGELTGISVAVQEITEKKKTEEELRKLNEQLEQRVNERTATLQLFRGLLDQAGDAFFIVDPETSRFIDVNKGACESMGYTRAELLERGVVDIEINLTKLSEWKAHMEELRQKKTLLFLGQHRRKDGSLFPVEVSVGYASQGARDYVISTTRDITNRKQVEARLEESESRYRALFESSSDAVMLLNEKGFFDANKATLEMFGASKEEFSRLHPSELSPPQQPDGEDSRTKADRMIAIAFNKGKNFFEWTHRRKNGQDFPAEVLLSAFQLDARPVLQATVRDITERKRAEEEIRAVRQQIEFILGATKTGLDILDKDYNLRYIDPEWGKIYGDPAGRKCHEYFMGLSEPCPGCAVQKAFETKQIVVSEEILVKEGNRPVQVTTIPYQTPMGEWLVAEVNVDITQRKAAEEQLRVQGELLKNVIEHVPHFVFWKDRDSAFLGCNQNFAKVAGFSSPDELIGKTDYDMPWKKEEADYYRKCDREVVESGQPMLNIEEPQLQSDGREAVLLTSKVPLKDSEGNVIGLLGIFADITELKKRDALAAKSEFLSMVSHELRTPLHCISEGISIVLEGLAGKLNKKQTDILVTSKKNVERLSRLVNSALQFQKLEIEAVAFSLGHHDINEMVQSVRTMMETFIQNKGVDFILKLGTDIPRVKCDRDKVLQVLWNLVHNAFKFTNKGSVTVTTALIEKGRSVKICVEDTGAGIKEEELTKVFMSPQESSSGRKKKKSDGMGLGLAISKKIIERHGGHISAESVYGKGSIFSFTLPVM